MSAVAWSTDTCCHRATLIGRRHCDVTQASYWRWSRCCDATNDSSETEAQACHSATAKHAGGHRQTGPWPDCESSRWDAATARVLFMSRRPLIILSAISCFSCRCSNQCNMRCVVVPHVSSAHERRLRVEVLRAWVSVLQFSSSKRFRFMR